MVWYGLVWFVGHIPERFGNSGLSQKTKDTGNTIFQGSKDTWCIGGTHACLCVTARRQVGMVFMEGDNHGQSRGCFQYSNDPYSDKEFWKGLLFSERGR